MFPLQTRATWCAARYYFVCGPIHMLSAELIVLLKEDLLCCVTLRVIFATRFIYCAHRLSPCGHEIDLLCVHI